MISLNINHTTWEAIAVVFNALAVIAVIVFQMIIYRKTQFTLKAVIANQAVNYREIEALFSMFSILKIRAPLPAMRGWAISPDFANTMISKILEKKPKVIVELGSGVSTLISAYCLESIGEGKIISIEHDNDYANKILESLDVHNLGHLVDLRHAPLSSIKIEEKDWYWYAIEAFEKIQAIDLLVIDGPPSSYSHMIRYPALPLLIELLNDNAVILIDDANRAEESKMVEQWLKQFSNIEPEYVDNEKGVFVLRKHTPSQVVHNTQICNPVISK